MNDGWVKLHRKILDNPLFADVPPEWLRIAMYILLKANHEPKQWYDGKNNVSIPAGSFVTSLGNISKGCKVGVQVVRGALKYLENSAFITRSTTSQHTLLTVRKWAAYQAREQSSNIVDNNPATNGQQTGNKPATNQQQQLKNVRTKECKKNTGSNGQDALFELSAETNPEAFDPDEYFNDEFWPIVWKKAGIGDAQKAFQKWAKSRDEAERIKAAAIAQGPEIMERGKRSTRGTPILVSSWLNGKRFNDDLSEIETTEESPW